MNSKLILAIVIVALIGVVAATYHSNSGETVINSLGGVQTEPESVTDVAGVESDSDSQNVLDGSTPLTNEGQSSSSGQSTLKGLWNRYIANANSGFSSVASNAISGQSASTTSNNGASNSGNGGSSLGNNGSGTNNTNQGTSQGNQSNTNDNNTNVNSSKITSAQILAIAKNATPEGYSNAQPSIFSTTTVDGVVIYSVRYTVNGEVIGEAEIDGNTGKVVGGAYKDEVKPDVVKNSSSSSSSNTTNTNDSNSSQSSIKNNSTKYNSTDTSNNSTKKTNKTKKTKKTN